MTEHREERRVVTVLFADVVGSSKLAERLDPEDVRLVIGEAVARCINAVAAYGGTVKDLAGDGVLALFGAPVSHEDDPERALRAALEIAGSIDEYATEVRSSWDVEFGMRFGVHTGPVVVGKVGAGSREEYGAFGDAVNTAARLQAEAVTGGILVSQATRSHVVDVFEWGEPQTQHLKGKVTAVVAYPLRGLRRQSTLKTSGPLVGRDAEIRASKEVVDQLAAGRGGLLFVVGEPGIGKSRLANEIRRYATERTNCTWLDGRCVSYGESLPFWPFRDLIRSWLEIGATEPELRARTKLHRAVDKLFPSSPTNVYPYLATILGLKLEPSAIAQLGTLSPESLQHQTFTTFAELLAQLSLQRPLIFSIDDLHWADPSSLLLLEHLLPIAETSQLVLLLNHRPETQHGSW